MNAARSLGGCVVALAFACSGPSSPDAPTVDVPADVAAPDVPDTSAAAICPAYDAHARDCFGDDTGEDFLAECQAIYAGCVGVLPEVVRCRLESPCADLGRCTGLGC